MRRAETGSEQDPQPTHPVQSLITFFLCGWFITGCVWVYRIYWPDTQNPNMENFCNPVVYLFAFWLITTAYIFLGLFTSCICCFSIVSVLLKREYWDFKRLLSIYMWFLNNAHEEFCDQNRFIYTYTLLLFSHNFLRLERSRIQIESHQYYYFKSAIQNKIWQIMLYLFQFWRNAFLFVYFQLWVHVCSSKHLQSILNPMNSSVIKKGI